MYVAETLDIAVLEVTENLHVVSEIGSLVRVIHGNSAQSA